MYLQNNNKFKSALDAFLMWDNYTGDECKLNAQLNIRLQKNTCFTYRIIITSHSRPFLGSLIWANKSRFYHIWQQQSVSFNNDCLFDYFLWINR